MTVSTYPATDTKEQDLLDYFGDGSLGDVSIVGTVVLTSDVQYRNLVVPPSAVLVTNGWFVRASVSITVEVGGIIHADGTDGFPGYDNSNGTGFGAGGGQGGGVVALYTPTLAMNGVVRANGGNGGESTTNYPSGTVRNGGGIVDNGGGGGGAGNTYASNGGTASGGIGRTNGGPGKAGNDAYGNRARGGGPGGHGFTPEYAIYEQTSIGGGGLGRAGTPFPSGLVPEYFAGGSGGFGGTGQGYRAPGGTTWGRGGTAMTSIPYQRVTVADTETWQSFRAINVPYFFKGRPGPRPATYGGGGGGGGSGYYHNSGGGGGGGLIITCSKVRSGAGTYQVNPGVAGNVSSSIGGYPGPSVAASGNVFHFKYRD